jgi:hypothetical protein
MGFVVNDGCLSRGLDARVAKLRASCQAFEETLRACDEYLRPHGKSRLERDASFDDIRSGGGGLPRRRRATCEEDPAKPLNLTVRV